MSKSRRRADGKPEYRSIDQLLAEAAQDDVVQRQLRACWPPSVAPDEVFSPVEVPVWLTHTVAKPDDDGDWQELAAQLATSSAAHSRRRATARQKVEESLTKVADLTRRFNEQVSLSGSISPGIQLTPVGVEARLERFDADCPPVDDLPGDLAERLRQAARAASPAWWRRLLT